MSRTSIAILAGLALAAAAPVAANATIFFANYDPSNTAVTEKHVFLPLDYRLPDASQTFTDIADLSARCANVYCSYINGFTATTDFTVGSTFDASRLIVPFAQTSPYGNRRIGFDILHLNPDGSVKEGLGFMQLESGLIPGGTVVEADAPFGNAGAGYVDFNYGPIHFVAGDSYRISAHYAAGAAGESYWFLSDQAAAPGQSIQYTNGSPSNLRYQPAFALTDGGSLTFAAVSSAPEPEAWGLMIIGFLGTGAILRHGRRTARAPALNWGN